MSNKPIQIVVGKDNVEAFLEGKLTVLRFDWKPQTMERYSGGDLVEVCDCNGIARKIIGKVHIKSIERVPAPTSEKEIAELKDDWELMNKGDFDQSKFNNYINKLSKFKADPVRIELEIPPSEQKKAHPEETVPEGYERRVSLKAGSIIEVYGNDGEFEVTGVVLSEDLVGEYEGFNESFVTATNMDTAKSIEVTVNNYIKVNEEGEGSDCFIGMISKENPPSPATNEAPKVNLDTAKEIESLKFKLGQSTKENAALREEYMLLHDAVAKAKGEGLKIQLFPFLERIRKAASIADLDGSAISNHFADNIEQLINQLVDTASSKWVDVAALVREKEDDPIYGDSHESVLTFISKVSFDSMRMVVLEGGSLKIKTTFDVADGGKLDETREAKIAPVKSDIKQMDLFQESEKEKETSETETNAGDSPPKAEVTAGNGKKESSPPEPAAEEKTEPGNAEPSSAETIDPYEEGIAAAEANKKASDNPYEVGSLEHESWSDGFEMG